MLVFASQVIGGSAFGAVPLASGPRQWCQFSRRALSKLASWAEAFMVGSKTAVRIKASRTMQAPRRVGGGQWTIDLSSRPRLVVPFSPLPAGERVRGEGQILYPSPPAPL